VQGWLAGQALLLGRARSRSKPERQEELESGEGGFSLGWILGNDRCSSYY